MNNYRNEIKNHFSSIAGFNKLMNVDYLFWTIGLVLTILGGMLVFANGAAIAADIIESIGFPAMWFGVALAFIKKNDWGLMIPMGAMALFELVLFIILLVHRVAPIGSIIYFLAYGTLFFLSYRISEVKKRVDLRRSRQAAVLAQQLRAVDGVLCTSCGAPIAGDAAFCPKCGVQAASASAGACKSCGAALQADDLFCPGCGTKLKEN